MRPKPHTTTWSCTLVIVFSIRCRPRSVRSSPLAHVLKISVDAKNIVKMPSKASAIVNARPAIDIGCTSPNPMVVSVMTAM
jgi:hypothetical protein